jgi:hypothetical protein
VAYEWTHEKVHYQMEITQHPEEVAADDYGSMEAVRKNPKDDPPPIPLLRESGAQCKIRFVKGFQEVEGWSGGART